jgi:hypothetical protein
MNKKITEELELLFALVPPNKLRRSLNRVFYSYLIYKKDLPRNYRNMAEDLHFLLEFLEEAEALLRQNEK